jgi:nucleoid-associated protein YgaU
MLGSARRLGNLVALLTFEAATIATLHRLGRIELFQIDWTDLPAWSATRHPEDVLAAALRVSALAVAYWVAATTVLYLGAVVGRIGAVVRLARPGTLPVIRRAVERAATVTLTAATLAAPAASMASPPPPVIFEIGSDGLPIPVAPESGRPDGVAPPGAGGPGYTPTSTHDDSGTAERSSRPGGGRRVDHGPAIHDVVAGDNLWSIAEMHLEAVKGEPRSAAETADYWLRVVDANRDRLRSGDPDLIYPGEKVRLPVIEGTSS